MKSSKIWKIIWIVGMYLILGLILYLVVVYKVEWEHKDLNTYLYLYDCSHSLCSTTDNRVDYYSKVLCENDKCPYIDTIMGDNLLLRNETTSWIYNYIQGEIVNDDYTDYRYIGNNRFVVSDETKQYGVIDIEGNILVELKYNYIDNYKNDFISYIKDNLYGIIDTKGIYNIDPIYDDIVLINNKIFAGKKDNVYQLYSYSDINSESSNKYDFVYSYDNIIFVISNKKIDILDTNLNSTLLMKIDTFYEYKVEQERDSLDIYFDGENICFKVFISESEYTIYKYNVSSKKIV